MYKKQILSVILSTGVLISFDIQAQVQPTISSNTGGASMPNSVGTIPSECQVCPTPTPALPVECNVCPVL